MEWLRAMGPGQDVDVDQAALRVTLDVIGLVGSSEQGQNGHKTRANNTHDVRCWGFWTSYTA